MLRIKLFDGEERPLVIYNGQAVLNLDVQFFTEECDDDLITEEESFSFPGYVSSYFRIFNERLGTRIRSIALSTSGGSLIINASALDMTFDVNGNYYYELGYVQTGGYDTVLAFGTLMVK